MITAHHQNTVQNQNNIIIGNISFESGEKFKYLGEVVTNTRKLNAE